MLYIKNENNLSVIVCKNKIQKAEKLAFSIVKRLCERELFSYESRIKLTKEYLSIKTKIPIYINNEILLMPSKSPKRYETIWINYYEIFSYQKHFNNTLVLFNDLKEIKIDISYNTFNKMYLKANKLENYIRNRLLEPKI